VFDGLLGMVHDQNMYYSFIRQGAEGEWLFLNRLTHIEHQPALFNLEWLAVGRLTAWLGGWDAGAYAIWRIIGACLLIGGFESLTALLLKNPFQRRLALWMCVFGGGFGGFFLVLERSGLIATGPESMLDISDAIHPFSHIFFNPHLSTSHGLSLLFLAAFVRGEQTGRPRWYVIGALIAAIHGLVRPYDLILVSGAIPLFVLMERWITGNWSLRTTALRVLPLAVIAPVIGYHAYLFQLHPVFKHWASQGGGRPFDVLWHFLSLGWAGGFCMLRLCLLRRFPLRSAAERLMLVWVVAVLFLLHGHRLPFLSFMPYTRVFGVTLPSTMLVLGAVLFDPEFLRNARFAWTRPVLVAALVLVSSLGSGIWLAKICRNLANRPEHYVSPAEFAAHGWLGEHAERSHVILSTLDDGNRMAKYISARFVLGHGAVTPHVDELSRRVERFYSGTMSPREVIVLLDELHVRWIYLDPAKSSGVTPHLPDIPGIKLQYANNSVSVFSYIPRDATSLFDPPLLPRPAEEVAGVGVAGVGRGRAEDDDQ
jgi:hypothetical protein